MKMNNADRNTAHQDMKIFCRHEKLITLSRTIVGEYRFKFDKTGQ